MTIVYLGLFKEVLGGLVIGIMFGFLLQKAGVTRFETIKKQLLLQDFTVMKVILTAIASGSLFLYLYRHFIEHKELIISTTTLPAAFFGGAIFGIGMAILGYCPGTCVGALAEKSKAAIWGIFGMIFGAFGYSQWASLINKHLKPTTSINKSTLDQTLNVTPIYIILFLVSIVGLLYFLDRRKKA